MGEAPGAELNPGGPPPQFPAAAAPAGRGREARAVISNRPLGGGLHLSPGHPPPPAPGPPPPPPPPAAAAPPAARPCSVHPPPTREERVETLTRGRGCGRLSAGTPDLRTEGQAGRKGTSGRGRAAAKAAGGSSLAQRGGSEPRQAAVYRARLRGGLPGRPYFGRMDPEQEARVVPGPSPARSRCQQQCLAAWARLVTRVCGGVSVQQGALHSCREEPATGTGSGKGNTPEARVPMTPAHGLAPAFPA